MRKYRPEVTEMSAGNFRKSLFGGFNRQDVADYVAKLAEERNGYKQRAEKAEEELAALREQALPAEEPAPELPEEAPAEETPDIESMLAEIRASVAAVNAGIQESVASIKSEMKEAEETEAAAAETPADKAAVSEDISRVLGMLECTEAHFTLLEKTLQTIKTDARKL